MATGVDWGAAAYWGELEGHRVVGWHFAVGVPLNAGDEVASITFANTPPDPADLDLHLTVSVALNEGPEIEAGKEPTRLRANGAIGVISELIGRVAFAMNLHFVPLFAGERPFPRSA